MTGATDRMRAWTSSTPTSATSANPSNRTPSATRWPSMPGIQPTTVAVFQLRLVFLYRASTRSPAARELLGGGRPPRPSVVVAPPSSLDVVLVCERILMAPIPVRLLSVASTVEEREGSPFSEPSVVVALPSSSVVVCERILMAPIPPTLSASDTALVASSVPCVTCGAPAAPGPLAATATQTVSSTTTAPR